METDRKQNAPTGFAYLHSALPTSAGGPPQPGQLRAFDLVHWDVKYNISVAGITVNPEFSAFSVLSIIRAVPDERVSGDCVFTSSIATGVPFWGNATRRLPA